MIDNREAEERVILVAVRKSDRENTEQSLDELCELASTAGAVTVARVIQNLDNFNPATYIGKGKIDEIKELIIEYDATGIICDDELSPAQMNNLSDALEIKVMDRTLLILDIFAARANTNEGKIQVELAQLRYRSSRLSGFGNALSRLGGGIGTRGPGETKLEMDRRIIHERIGQLKHELEAVVTHRELTRSQRSRSNIPVVAIVGYTNAGKSTLLNTLTGAGILAENKLFATLDPTTRGLELESGQQILLTDTVGFISKLPHHLVEAFKSTLEEAVYADIILHVVDASNPAMDSQMHVVYDTLEKLGAGDKPIITAFNKIEIAGNKVLKDFKADKTVNISALHGDGLTELKDTIEEVLRESKIYIEKTYSYTEASKISLIRKYGQLISEEYVAEGIEVKAYVPTEIYDKVK
ncbi:GTPase HflX [Eshraghiella crossota]|uniref:GTPase HflX n=1 Tax=Eshraghiella crossota TaxID=45851 RepID=UPI003FD6DC55